MKTQINGAGFAYFQWRRFSLEACNDSSSCGTCDGIWAGMNP